jgi:hypothetical protein
MMRVLKLASLLSSLGGSAVLAIPTTGGRE